MLTKNDIRCYIQLGRLGDICISTTFGPNLCLNLCNIPDYFVTEGNVLKSSPRDQLITCYGQHNMRVGFSALSTEIVATCGDKLKTD